MKMKRFIVAIALAILFITTTSVFAEEDTKSNLVWLINLDSVSKVQVYNPTGKSFKAIITVDSDDGEPPKEVTFQWIAIEPEPVADPEPTEP